MRSTLSAFRVTFMSIVAALPLAGTAHAQLCFGDDNLDQGQCWQAIDAHLPQFPGIQLPSLGVCWRDCMPDQKLETRILMSPPQQVRCSEYESEINVLDSMTGE